MINFAENLNKMITAGLGGETEAPRTEVAVGHRLQYLEVSGPVASFNTNIVAPLKKFLVNILPVQAGSGDPSPENIRPISGRSSVTVIRSGKNLYDDSTLYHGAYYQSTGALTPGETYRTVIIDYLPAGSYTFSTDLPDAYLLRRWIDGVNTTISSKRNIYTFTIDKGGFFMLSFRANDSAVITDPVHVQMKIGSTVTDYESPDIISASVQLGRDVYGGTLDVTTGKLRITFAYALLNDPDKWVEYSGSVAKYQYTERYTDRKLGSRTVMACSAFPVFETGIPLSIGWLNSFNSTNIGIVDTNSVLSLSDLKTLAGNNSIEIVYELAEAVEIDLTPQQITTLIGDNNIWSDSGNVDVTYIYYEKTEGY